MVDPLLAVLHALLEKRPIRTRIRETGHGDVHDVLWPVTVPSGSTGTVVAFLEGLEAIGFACQTEVVHPEDTSEFLVSWSLSPAWLQSHREPAR